MFDFVTLEVSLKPFKKTDDESIRRVCSRIFTQWLPLIKNRKTVSVMLWTADGSEILDYSGNLNDSFEWCRYIGIANKPIATDQDNPALSLHDKKRYYTENPPVMTYRILKRIIEILKEEGKKACPGAVIRVGETFDIGPEFAVSDFKYNRHTEICTGTKLGSLGLLDATGLLNGDTVKYAAYPNGIPDQTPFGTFFGKQANVFLKDMGFDYIWLSNGLGFSSDPWDITGKIFDGENFHVERLAKTKENVFLFWKLFREACPDFLIETRGTNNSVGIDYASDGVPLYDIYNAGLNIAAPPNSPWAALNDNFGLEIMGHMTRICELPQAGFMFRYYIHDPWWVNSPWYDRYNGSPHDIYLPMAISRVGSDGSVKTAERFNILSIDNSFGEMPDCCVNEPLPHILKAEKDAPDGMPPFVWVYPMREYTTTNSEQLLYEMYYGDRFICEAINNGFPLNCVVSSDIFLKTPISAYQNSVIVSPVQPNGEVMSKLKEFNKQGGKIIYYSTCEKLKKIESNKNIALVDICTNADAMRAAASKFEYCIEFDCKKSTEKTPAITVHKNNNATIFSVYNPNTTTDTLIKFPLGAPILDCYEAEIVDGFAKYRFPRCEHKECRVFVKQKSGVVSVKEKPPVNALYRRKILIGGLEAATVYVFPEYKGAEKCGFVNTEDLSYCDATPVLDNSWELITDSLGTYYKAENITGDYLLCMPAEKYI
ncbi:MAG: hypothetical protein IKD04_00660 [Clostridia bacterium]|nr:hypothetical protein [Clostridia bacterium]